MLYFVGVSILPVWVVELVYFCSTVTVVGIGREVHTNDILVVKWEFHTLTTFSTSHATPNKSVCGFSTDTYRSGNAVWMMLTP